MTETVSRFDIPRLDKAIEGITLSPETWNQSTWRCASGMCIAGHIVEQNGDTWATEADRPGSDYVLVPEGTEYAQPRENAQHWAKSYSFELPEGMTLILAAQRAGSLLGLPDDSEDHRLFNGNNSLADIRRYRDQMADGLIPYSEDDDDDEYDY